MFLKNLNNKEKNAFYILAGKVVNADGIIIDNEEYLLDEYLQEMGLDEDDINYVSFEDAIDDLELSSIQVKKQIYIELFALAMCDENVADEEVAVLEKIANCFKLDKNTVKSLKEIVTELLDVYRRMNLLIAE